MLLDDALDLAFGRMGTDGLAADEEIGADIVFGAASTYECMWNV